MSIDALRAELDEVDRRLLEAVAERQRLVAAIKARKRATGRHSFDRAREQEVLRKAAARGEALGLPDALTASLMTTLLEASHALQEAPAPEVAHERRSIAIVGGRGKMGRRLGEAFAARGHRIAVIEQGDPLDAARAADVVMVAVPMTDAAEVVRALAPLVREDALLCDINSLKGEVCGALAQARGEALGTHPMFGPTVRSLRRQKVVLCDVKPGPMAAWLEAELGRMGAEVIHTTPEQHDAMMAVVQVLTHFGIMAMGRALSESGHPLAASLPFTSPIYRLELAMVGRLFSQRPELYREILMRNPHGAPLRQVFLREAEALHRILDAGDDAAFAERFEATRDYFADFSEEAMALSDHIIETIMSRP